MVSGYLTAVARQIQSLVIDKLDATKFGVNHSAWRDPWYLGPELARDIDATDGPFLNAIILSPLPTAVYPADEQAAAEAWQQEWLLYFVYRRETSLADVAANWAEPLADVLRQYQLTRLGGLRYYDDAGRQRGHCTGFRVVGPPDLYVEAENNVLNGLGLACFALTLRVESLIALDPDRSKR